MSPTPLNGFASTRNPLACTFCSKVLQTTEDKKIHERYCTVRMRAALKDSSGGRRAARPCQGDREAEAVDEPRRDDCYDGAREAAAAAAAAIAAVNALTCGCGKSAPASRHHDSHDECRTAAATAAATTAAAILRATV